ncbi:hypothetical protein BC938DRAFT_475952, partial [Jimgerdemannia flammicorona]
MAPGARFIQGPAYAAHAVPRRHTKSTESASREMVKICHRRGVKWECGRKLYTGGSGVLMYIYQIHIFENIVNSNQGKDMKEY